MTRSIIVACLCVAALAGCGRTIVRETVVERPVIASAPIVTAPASCSLGSTAYTSGSLSCQAGVQYRCNNGAWEPLPRSYC